MSKIKLIVEFDMDERLDEQELIEKTYEKLKEINNEQFKIIDVDLFQEKD